MSNLADDGRDRDAHSADKARPPMIRGSNVIRSNVSIGALVKPCLLF